jgi:hypothetical protein
MIMDGKVMRYPNEYQENTTSWIVVKFGMCPYSAHLIHNVFDLESHKMKAENHVFQ